MTPRKPNPGWRIAAVLALVAAIGGLGGYAWERNSQEDPEEPLVSAPTEAELGVEEENVSGPSVASQEVVRRATQNLPPYKGAVPEAVAADYLGARAPIAVAWFSTHDSIDEVFGFYRDAFEKAGLPVVEKRYGPGSGYVGYMDPKDDEVHLISAMAQGGETMVFPSAGKMAGLAEGTPEVPESLPHPKEATGTMVLKLGQESAAQYSLVAQVPGGTVADVVEFYRKGFLEKGWQVRSVTTTDPTQTRVEASRGTSVASAVIRVAPTSDGVQVYVSMTQRG